MSDLRTLPAIRAEAERLARETYEAQSKTLYAHGMGPSLLWDLLPERMRTAYVGAHIDLLRDLSRPASMDAVARLVAARLGVKCGAIAPPLSLLRRGGVPTWCLGGEDGWQWITNDLVPGICPVTITDPADALRLIALHVLREPA